MLRKLKDKDCELMLEWMRDDDITSCFREPFEQYTKEKVLNFIKNSFNDNNQHFAIVDLNDNYLGTISLKNISYINKNAEYAIVMRKQAQGKGLATEATNKILQYAFKDLKLHKIYLNVLEENKKAIRLYEKVGFIKEGISVDHIFKDGKYRNLSWYAIINN